MIPEITLCVSELNDYIDGILKRDGLLKCIRIRGEIGSFKHHFASGHWYFSLKDDTGSISCAMYRHNNIRCSFVPQDGMKVILTGSLGLYQKNGQLQINVTSIRPDGEGELWKRMEALKARLSAEGLFDTGRKRPLPLYPRKIAVVTSESGAVWHDIVNVSLNRNPSVQIVLIPVSVQGQGAEKEIAEGIRTAQNVTDAELIIVGRGGGSLEDLWCFNEETVARAVAQSRIPVISAVGHETDYTICDLVADVRASTPSNAAEIAVPTVRELQDGLSSLRKDLTRITYSRLEEYRLKVLRLRNSLLRFEPSRYLADIRGEIVKKRMYLDRMIAEQIRNKKDRVEKTREKIDLLTEMKIRQLKAVLETEHEKLLAISPLSVLERGYAIVSDIHGNAVSSAEEASRERILKIRFHDGETKAERRENDE